MKYQEKGTSKANLLRCFIELERNILVVKVLKKLLEYKEFSSCVSIIESDNSIASLKIDLVKIIDKLASESIQCTDMLENFLSDQDLEELISSIERDVQT